MTHEELNEIKKNYKVIEIAVDFINPSYNISRAKHLDNARYIMCTLTENGIPTLCSRSGALKHSDSKHYCKRTGALETKRKCNEIISRKSRRKSV